jgi:hypothetical protein
VHSIGWLVCVSPATAYRTIMLSHFPDPNQHILTFLHPKFTVQGNILSTPGDALTELHIHFQNNFNYFSRKANDDVAG